MAENCLFCKIVRGEIPSKIVAENAAGIAFRDINPEAPVHVLVIPREHFLSLNEIPRELLADVMDLVREVAKSEGVSDRGYRVVFNTHSDGGQTVGHVHAHVLGGRHMNWPPG